MYFLTKTTNLNDKLGGLAKDTLKSARENDIDFEDIEGTYFLRNYSEQKLIHLSLHKWQKIKKRGVYQILMPQLFLTGDYHGEFLRNFGRCFFEPKKIKSLDFPILKTVSLPPSHDFWCNRNHWPRDTPGYVLFSYQCNSCKMSWASIDLSDSAGNYARLGMTAHIRLALSTSHALGFMKNAGNPVGEEANTSINIYI